MKPEEKLLWQFFYHQHREFRLRELAREAKLDAKTVQKYLRELCRRGLVVRKEAKGRFPRYEANWSNPLYRQEKSHALIRRILESGLIPHLERELQPKAIVLFGSVHKGGYGPDSDIDLYVQTPRQWKDLTDFEEHLGHEIHLTCVENPRKLGVGVLRNIYRGRVLSGTFDLPRKGSLGRPLDSA
jgi:predicted nucleotidyltransferase